MANRDCNGDHFTANGRHFYVCFWDSTVLHGVSDGEVCPHCRRTVDSAQQLGDLSVERVEFAVGPHGRRFELPNAALTRGPEKD